MLGQSFSSVNRFHTTVITRLSPSDLGRQAKAPSPRLESSAGWRRTVEVPRNPNPGSALLPAVTDPSLFQHFSLFSLDNLIDL